MGLLGDLFKNRSLKDPVPGTFQVTTSSQMPHGAMSGNARLMGVVTGDGVPPTSVEHNCIARTSKWPRAGMTLPVLVDRADPTSFKIRWDEVADGWNAGKGQADALAQAMQGGGFQAQAIDARGVPGLREEVLGLVGQGGSPDEIVAALRARGIAIPPGAQVNVVSSSGDGDATPRAADGDPAERLRKLDALKEGGLVSDAEYQDLRAKILADL